MADDRAGTLYLLRHAKSARPALVDDVARPLAGRGRRDAKAAAAVLATRRPPHLVLCSPSLRTRQTWQLVRQGISGSPKVRFEPVIYGADWADVVDLLRTVPAVTGTVLVIGHEPTLSETVLRLAGSGSSRHALRQLATKFPTSGLATLEVPGSWADLGRGTARLKAFDVPRG